MSSLGGEWQFRKTWMSTSQWDEHSKSPRGPNLPPKVVQYSVNLRSRNFGKGDDFVFGSWESSKCGSALKSRGLEVMKTGEICWNFVKTWFRTQIPGLGGNENWLNLLKFRQNIVWLSLSNSVAWRHWKVVKLVEISSKCRQLSLCEIQSSLVAIDACGSDQKN